ncbi:MAG TPA: hypothetical protein IGS53_06400 [Leptolyngbyaceae cyanobacterium M33_DOE_097]|uniref:Uncharacterized protein n=1 Tax=Oscillatoriales cyanobacterium SpSt-418 TaxID=2282169 RepID=A0A7C3KJP5_9CYAN|nr:hypothetical protein [Leptolyngbyaceae cyanobacterium M33_DOE_097]
MPALQQTSPKISPPSQVIHTTKLFKQPNQGDLRYNRRLTSPVPSASDRSVKLATRTIWLANHSTPTRMILRGL